MRFSKAGSKSKVEGRWFTRYSEVKGMTPEQISDYLDLNYVPDQMTTVNPAGFTVREGTINAPKIPGGQGGTQYQVMKELPYKNYGSIIKLQNNTTIEETVNQPEYSGMGFPKTTPKPTPVNNKTMNPDQTQPQQDPVDDPIDFDPDPDPILFDPF